MFILYSRREFTCQSLRRWINNVKRSNSRTYNYNATNRLNSDRHCRRRVRRNTRFWRRDLKTSYRTNFLLAFLGTVTRAQDPFQSKSRDERDSIADPHRLVAIHLINAANCSTTRARTVAVRELSKLQSIDTQVAFSHELHSF